MKTRTTTIWIAAAAALLAAGCGNPFFTRITSQASAPALTGIDVTSPPTKTVYAIGEDFDPAGMVVDATYDDGTTREVPLADLEITGFDSASAGMRTVTVSYQGHTATTAVTVLDPAAVLTGIEVATPPTKTVYAVGEDFDPAGMVVTATYDDGLTREVPHGDLAITGFDSASAGTRTVTVSYRGHAATVDVTVEPIPITGAAVTVTAPVRLQTPDMAASGTGNFTVGQVAWTPADNPFLGGTAYTATVILTANANHVFAAGLAGAATVNGNPATVTDNDGDRRACLKNRVNDH